LAAQRVGGEGRRRLGAGREADNSERQPASAPTAWPLQPPPSRTLALGSTDRRKATPSRLNSGRTSGARDEPLGDDVGQQRVHARRRKPPRGDLVVDGAAHADQREHLDVDARLARARAASIAPRSTPVRGGGCSLRHRGGRRCGRDLLVAGLPARPRRLNASARHGMYRRPRHCGKT